MKIFGILPQMQPHKLMFLPPNKDFVDLKLYKLIAKTRAELAELKGYSTSLQNPLLLLSPAITKESLASSEIENINTTIINVLENQLFPEDQQKQPDKEVLRYSEALHWGYKNLRNYGLTTRLITGIQNQLLPDKPAGYRKLQNGIKNIKTGEIVYIPPSHLDIPNLITNLEVFTNSKEEENNDIDPLVKTIISHYQFEAIHPFDDGNGRTGRILMVLQLIQEKILDIPILYISGYINKNKSTYYELLNNVTKNGNWYDYVIFMLNGFCEQAKTTKTLLFNIRELYFKQKTKLKSECKNIYSSDLVDAIFTMPIITPSKLAEILSVEWETAKKYLNKCESIGLLQQRKIKKYRLYMNKELIDLLHN